MAKKVCINLPIELVEYLRVLGPEGWVMERLAFAAWKGIKQPGTKEHQFLIDLFGNDFENKLECSETQPFELRPKQ